MAQKVKFGAPLIGWVEYEMELEPKPDGEEWWEDDDAWDAINDAACEAVSGVAPPSTGNVTLLNIWVDDKSDIEEVKDHGNMD
jgi:hypothetical protein